MSDAAPQRNSGFPVLPGELAVRFGCGAMLGLLAGFFGILRWINHPTWVQLIAWMVGSAIVCGLLARAGGDEFWRNLRGWWV
jgi:hypothetical protein